MKYRCVSCDHVFDYGGSDKPRCPRCLGIHEVERVQAKPQGEPAAKPRRPTALIVVVVLALVGIGAYVALTKGLVGGKGGTAAPPGDLRAALIAAGVEEGEVVLPFEPNEAIREFAESAADGRDGAAALEALVAALGDLKGKGRWAPHHQRTPRLTPPVTAAELLAEISKERAEPFLATSYELACLLLAAARAAGVDDAVMAQIFSFDGAKSPADPAGKLGRFGVALGTGGGGERPPLFDPYELRTGKAALADARALTDAEAIAPYYSHRSLALWTARKSAEALALNEIATKLDGKCATYRAGRGLIFMSSGGEPREYIAEFEKAIQRRDDAVSRLNLAEALIAVDPSGARTEAELHAALEKMPDYARARAALAALYAARGDFEAAEAELAGAERLAPDSPDVAFAWAGYYAARRDGERAIEKAQQALRLAGEDIDSLLSVAGIYSVTARFDEMRAVLDKVLAMTDSPEIASFIEAMFGYAPGGQESAAAGGAADAGAPGGGLAGDLELGADRKAGPSLLGGDGLKLGPGLGGDLGGLGGGLGGGLPGGGGAPSGGLKLKYDMNN